MLQLEANEFIQYLEREASCVKQFNVSGNLLYFYHDKDRYSYKFMNTVIVRQLNNQGYITVCYDVDQLKYVVNSDGLMIQLTLAKGSQKWTVESFIPYRLEAIQ